MVETSSQTIEALKNTILPDPLQDRKLKDSACLIMSNRPLADDNFWSKPGVPDWKLLQHFFMREGTVTKSQCVKLLRLVLDVFKKEPNLVSLDEPICVVGDIHGQYADLLNMMSKAGEPGTLNYLFLGDYVDRGIYGIEVCLLLFAIKLNHPKSVLMLRGNHESRNMTESFTFRQEVIGRFD